MITQLSHDPQPQRGTLRSRLCDVVWFARFVMQYVAGRLAESADPEAAS